MTSRFQDFVPLSFAKHLCVRFFLSLLSCEVGWMTCKGSIEVSGVRATTAPWDLKKHPPSTQCEYYIV